MKGEERMKKVKWSLFTLLIVFSVFLASCSSSTDQSSGQPGNGNEESQKNTENTNDVQIETEVKQYYFTANEGGSISKIDATTNEVVKTIEVEGIVHNVQVSADGKTLAATVVPTMHHGSSNDDSMKMKGQVLFFDTETNELLKSIDVGNHPAHVVFSDNGKNVLVTNNEDDNISVIDIENYTLKGTIDTGHGPHGFRISQDSEKAYIANMGEDTVSVINIESMKEERKITVGATPVTTGITSDEKVLVATLNQENMLVIVDLGTDQVEKIEVGNGPAQVFIDVNNQFAYVANQGTEASPSHSVSVVELASRKVVATIETGKGSHGVVTSTDNKRIYVTNMFDNTVTVIDKEQNKVIDTIEVGQTPNGISTNR